MQRRCPLEEDCMALVTAMFIVSFLPRYVVSPSRPPTHIPSGTVSDTAEREAHKASDPGAAQTNSTAGVQREHLLSCLLLNPLPLPQLRAAVPLGIAAHVLFRKKLVPKVKPGRNDSPWPCHLGRRGGEGIRTEPASAYFVLPGSESTGNFQKG